MAGLYEKEIDVNSLDFDVIYDNIAEFIRHKRREKEMSFSEMAYLTGISASQIYKIENRQSKVGIIGLFRICLVFDVSFLIFLPTRDCDSNMVKVQRLLSQMSEEDVERFYREILDNSKKEVQCNG